MYLAGKPAATKVRFLPMPQMVLFVVNRNYFIFDIFILYLATTTTTTPSFCAATCTGAFNSAGGTSCSQICDDSTSLNTCSSSSTICPNANSAYYYFGVAPNGLSNIFGYNSYCNSAYASNYLNNGFNPCYGGSNGYFNTTNYPALIPNNSCCVFDAYFNDYYCIQYPCISSG